MFSEMRNESLNSSRLVVSSSLVIFVIDGPNLPLEELQR
jgi:hypothetical protein